MQPSVVGEVITKRARNAKHYLMTDGSYMAVISQCDVHFQDQQGNWHNLDTRLVDEADFDAEEQDGRPVAAHIREAFMAKATEVRATRAAGRTVNRDLTDWQVLRAPHTLTLPKNIKRGYSIGHGTDKLWFIPVGASPSRGQVSPNDAATVEYQDVWAQVDVRLTVTPIGIKEVLVLKTVAAARTFSWEVDGPLADDLTCGSLQVHQGSLRDAAGTVRTVPVVKRVADGKLYLDIMPDVSGLVVPVEVDPTVTYTVAGTGNNMDLITMGDSYPPPSFAGTEQGTTLRPSKTNDGTNYYTNRVTLVRWDTSGLPDAAAVSAATLRVYVTGKQASDSRSLVAEWYSGAWDSSAATANVGTSALPGTPLSTIPMGSVDFALTSLANVNLTGTTALRIGISGAAPAGGNELNFYSATGTTPPQLLVTYSMPPGTPTVTAPNGGETWNAQHTITWTAATDPDTAQGSLRYQIQLSTDNRATWSDIIALTTAGATSYPYDFSTKPESAACFIRIRAYDGTNYGPWDESSAAFTILHNQAPFAPTNLQPSGGTPVDRAATVRLSWVHQDLNGDVQSKFTLQWSPDGGSNWNTVTEATPNQYWDAPAGTFIRGTITWRVQTYDQADLVGPYATQVDFFAGDKPATPVFLDPLAGGTVSVSRPVVQWSSSGQAGYQLQATTDLGVVLWDGGDTTGGVKSAAIGADLANNTQAVLKIRIRNSDGIWSDWASAPVTVSYTPPLDAQTLAAVGDATVAAIRVTWDRGIVGGNQNTSFGELWRVRRRVKGQATWGEPIDVANPLSSNPAHVDYSPASGQTYEYQVIAIGNNGTVSPGVTAEGVVRFPVPWLVHPTDSSQNVSLRLTDSTLPINHPQSVTEAETLGGARKSVSQGEVMGAEMDLTIVANHRDPRTYKLAEVLRQLKAQSTTWLLKLPQAPGALMASIPGRVFEVSLGAMRETVSPARTVVFLPAVEVGEARD